MAAFMGFSQACRSPNEALVWKLTKLTDEKVCFDLANHQSLEGRNQSLLALDLLDVSFDLSLSVFPSHPLDSSNSLLLVHNYIPVPSLALESLNDLTHVDEMCARWS